MIKISSNAILKFEADVFFVDDKTLIVNQTSSDPLEGFEKELITLTFNWQSFKT